MSQRYPGLSKIGKVMGGYPGTERVVDPSRFTMSTGSLRFTASDERLIADVENEAKTKFTAIAHKERLKREGKSTTDRIQETRRDYYEHRVRGALARKLRRGEIPWRFTNRSGLSVIVDGDVATVYGVDDERPIGDSKVKLAEVSVGGGA